MSRPNFIVIVADDLGFTDLSPFGGEIETPNLDRIAKAGVRLTNFHTASACSPTRSMLLSGTDNHIAGLGQMDEIRTTFPELFKNKPGYEGYLNFRVAALSEILQASGYYTFLSGKWHLGLLPEYWPDKRGFEKSFTLLPGAGNHFKYFPKDKDGEYIKFLISLYAEDGEKLDIEEFPEDFYSTRYFTDKFIEKLEQKDDRPFFGLLTYTAPHWPLQAPPETIKKYKGKYDDGPAQLRRRRLARAKELGIVSEDTIPHQVETQRDRPWAELSPAEQKRESKIMEVYAAMVDEVDKGVGKILDTLEKKNELDNTVILFMSDNGAEGMLLEALPFGFLTSKNKQLDEYFDRSDEGIGKPNSFNWYSDQWAQAATAPSHMYKMWATEGGIRCPLIFSYPDLIKEGKILNGFATVMDILPTILDLAKVEQPKGSFQGRKIVDVKGKSWIPYFEEKQAYIHDKNTVTGWELFGQLAIRKGDWKAVYIPKPLGPEKWQLFNVEKDPGEIVDLAESEPEKLTELLEHWSEYEAETGLVDLTEELRAHYNAIYIDDP